MDQHFMELETIRSSGEEEWYCPSCGRRFLLQMQPTYKKTIVVAGDRSARHQGGSNTLLVASPQITLHQDANLNGFSLMPLSAQDLTPATEPPSDDLHKMLKDNGLDHLL